MISKTKWLNLFFLGFLSLYAVFSYTLVDPNLVLSSMPGLWHIQNLLWQIGYQQRQLTSLIYLGITVGLFLTYGNILLLVKAKRITNKMLVWLLVGSVVILFMSYPALSHDIFNYLFNAKMVLQYHTNPHVQVALDFPSDPWLRFMNNTHTPAPYAYGWTALSLIPSFLGFGHLKITMVLFRLFITGFFGLLLLAQIRLMPKENRLWFWAFALNPLILIETVGNIHNDVVMMTLLMWSLICAQKALRGMRWWWLPAVGLFSLSVSIKYASIMVLVGLLIFWIINLNRKRISFGGAQIIANFLPLITARSQGFLSWYLIWPMSWLPLSKEKAVNQTLVLFSVTGLLAYLPYILTQEYSPQLLFLRRIILFLPPIVYVITTILSNYLFKLKSNHETTK